MDKPLRSRILAELHRLRIPVVLIGAQAVKALGSPRESWDLDFAARNLDIDQIIDFMYGLGLRLPVATPEGRPIQWARSAGEAKKFVEREKSGALNFFITDESDNIVDQIDFVIDNPIPFAMLMRDADILSEEPALRRASIDHLITMKEKCLANRDKITDQVDLAFLRQLKAKAKRKRR